MPIVGDLGIALGFSNNKVWRLSSLDDPNFKFTGQFAAENLTENVGVRQSEVVAPQQSTPLIQFGSGEVETIKFRARIFRTSPVAGSAFDALSNPVGTAFAALQGQAGPLVSNGSVKDQIELLKRFARKEGDEASPAYGRQHRCLLQIGTEFSYEVFCRSPGGISYDDIRSDGTIRGASFEMEFVKIKTENLSQQAGVSTAAKIKTVLGVVTTVAGGISAINATRRDKLVNIPGGSLHRIDKFFTAKAGDTYEKVAAREYGNPMLGVTLRSAQPDKIDLKPNDKYFTVNRREILQIPIEPRSVALREGVESKALLEAFLALRGKPSSVVI